MWVVVCEVVVLGTVVWHCRALGQNASRIPPRRTPAPHLDNHLKCVLASVFVTVIFEGVQSISVG